LHRQAQILLRGTKNRLLDPSEIRAPEIKGRSRRSAIGSVSATIGIDWSILEIIRDSGVIGLAQNTVSDGPSVA